MWDHSSSSSLGNHCDKRTCISFQEVEARSEHSSAWTNENMPELVLEVRPSHEQQGQEPSSPLPVQLGLPLILMMGLWQEAQRVLEIRSHWAQNCQGRMWLTLMWTQPPETVSHAHRKGGCTNCLQKYQKVQASCRLSKGSLWTEAQLKRIGNSCQYVWGHDHKSIRTEQDCGLAGDHNSFEMWKMMVRTDQLLCIAKATGSKITPETQRPKPMAGWRLWYCCWNNTVPTITNSMKREWLGPW